MTKRQKVWLLLGIGVAVVVYRNVPDGWHLIPLVIGAALLGTAFDFIPTKERS